MVAVEACALLAKAVPMAMKVVAAKKAQGKDSELATVKVKQGIVSVAVAQTASIEGMHIGEHDYRPLNICLEGLAAVVSDIEDTSVMNQVEASVGAFAEELAVMLQKFNIELALLRDHESYKAFTSVPGNVRRVEESIGYEEKSLEERASQRNFPPKGTSYSGSWRPKMPSCESSVKMISVGLNILTAIKAIQEVLVGSPMDEAIQMCEQLKPIIEARKIEAASVSAHNATRWFFHKRAPPVIDTKPVQDQFEQAQHNSLLASFFTLVTVAHSAQIALCSHKKLIKIAAECPTWNKEVEEIGLLLEKARRINEKRLKMIEAQLKKNLNAEGLFTFVNVFTRVVQNVHTDFDKLEGRVTDALNKIQSDCEKVTAIKKDADNALFPFITSAGTAFFHARQNCSAVGAAITPGSSISQISLAMDVVTGTLAVGGLVLSRQSAVKCQAILSNFEDQRRQLLTHKEAVESERQKFLDASSEVAKKLTTDPELLDLLALSLDD